MSDTTTRAATYRELFAVREYRAIFAADVLSMLGDQIAAVALAVLVYERSGSPLLSAIVYSLVFLPWFAGGPVLAALADRWPRRTVLVTCDLLRCALIGLAALPGMPIGVLIALVAMASLLMPTFSSAKAAIIGQIVDGDRYVLANAVTHLIYQAGSLLGFVAGAALVALMPASAALAIDAATFACAATLVYFGVRHRPAAPREPEERSLLRETAEGVRIVLAHPVVFGLLLIDVVGATFAVVPEAVAPAYADSLDLGFGAVGLLMAAYAAGVVLGNVLLTRLVPPDARLRLIRPLAFASALPLLGAAARPGLATSVILFALVGVFSAYTIVANATVLAAVPDEARGRVFGVASTALAAAQAFAIICAGAAAQFLAPTTVVALAGALGAVAMAFLWAQPSRERPRATTMAEPVASVVAV